MGKPRGPDLSSREAKRVLAQLAEFGVQELYLSGGEPLMRRDLFELIKLAVELGMSTTVITNGWFITRERAFRLKRSGIEHVSVSVDGIGRVHDEFRNMPNSFSRCIRAIKLLREAGVKTYISPTFSRFNLHQLPELLELALELRSNFSAKVMIPIGEAEAVREQCLSPREQRRFYEYLAVKRAELKGRIEVVTTCNPYRAVVEGKSRRSKRIRGGCTAGISILCISPDGTVFPCSRLQVPLGSLRSSSIEDLWYSSEVLAKLRDRDNLGGKCGRCLHRSWCGGCRAMAFALGGDYLAEDPTCWLS